MKLAFPIIVLAFAFSSWGQSFSSAVDIVIVYSQNEQFYLRSVPYDNESPTTRGHTDVFKAGSNIPIYSFEIGFDSVYEKSNNLILGNNGETIVYVISWGANENAIGLHSLTIYKHGKILKELTAADVHGCDLRKERCDVLYSNYDSVVDREQSKTLRTRVYKPGVSEDEKFLSNYPIFSSENIVYLTDSKKQTHVFDLTSGEQIKTLPFESIFSNVRDLGRFNKTSFERIQSPIYTRFPKTADGRDVNAALASALGMTTVDESSAKDDKFKQYKFKINGNLNRDGTFEIENLVLFDDVSRDKLVEFFTNTKFDSSSIPEPAVRWNIHDEYFSFRKSDDKIARQEKVQENVRIEETRKKNLVAERINDIYIPKDLENCFTELDRTLTDVNKKEIAALKQKDDMVMYHMGLGMWIRNNWGLWGGSRLQQYFIQHGVSHPDDMSGIILAYYFDWTHGNKETWKSWEKSMSH